ncbi:MAG: hypothetical protein J6Z46_10510 [Lachnospiraceae bacterium]|nr:hypothetical protein [Lachnospiraceae bacterium]
MKKTVKIMCMVLGTALLMSFAACGKEPAKDPAKDPEDVGVVCPTADPSDPADVTGAACDPVTIDTPPAAAGFVFTFNGVDVRVDDAAADLVDKLGTYSYFEAPSCAFNGLDKIYTYTSFEIDTYPVGDADYISAIVFKDDTVETAEGACIGMKKEKIVEKYGAPAEESGTLSIYEKDCMQLRFIFDEEGYVISIQYLSSVV